MTHRNYIKCDVCKSVILVRTQIGWLPKHPIRIHCAKCSILISGEFTQNMETPEFDIRFENAEEVDMQTPHFYIEASGELLTSKMRPYVVEEDEYPLPPFFNTLHAMGGEEFEPFKKFSKNVNQFLYFIDNNWAFVRRIHELWINKKYEFLPSQMREYLPQKQFPLNNKLESLRGIHQLFLIAFTPVLPKNYYDKTTKEIFENIDFTAKSSNNFIPMLQYFEKNGLLDKFEQDSLRIISSFIDKYPFFISTISTDFYQYQVNYDKLGTTTTSFEDVKYFYQECFEVIGDSISLVIAYNNLKNRQDFNIMSNSSFANIKTLDDFLGKMKNKGNKIEFCRNDEVFNQIIRFDIDNGLRNAIGHGSYIYDGVNQVITYYSSGEKDRGDSETITLIEFIKKAWAQMQTIIILIELIYQTRKYCCIFCEGLIPTNPSHLFGEQNKKVGRNKPCPCGSGKKYKKCCLN